MKKEYKVTLIESDFDGDLDDTKDCIGYRSFKRALPWYSKWREVLWYNSTGELAGRMFYSINSEGHMVDMMIDAKVGDKITFRKI